MTEKLYENDAYLFEFAAKVKSCIKNGDFFEVVLDKTAFFPEGGGQGADKGTLNGEDVFDVQIKDGIIIHKTTAELETGTEVFGKVNAELRFARMQSHSAEHVVSGIVHSMFGYENVGFHLGERTMTVDFDGALNRDDIREVELRANKAIFANKTISVSYPSPEQAKTLEYRSKLDIIEGLRLVTIEDVDCCACCAPHVMRTGEIGLVKVIDFCPNKGGTRLEVIAGIYAVNDYDALNVQNKTLMKLFSAKRDEVEAAVTKQNDLVCELKAENSRLLKRLALAELSPIDINGAAYAFCDNLGYDELRFCANSLAEKGTKMCVLFSETEPNSYIYVASSVGGNVKPVVAELNGAFNGKGGGKTNYAQGKIYAENSNEIKALLEKILV